MSNLFSLPARRTWFGPLAYLAKKSLPALAILASSPAVAYAASVPTQIAVEGILQAVGGGPVADGSYNVVFTIYDAASAGNAVWTENATLTVAGGAFAYGLGSTKALDAMLFQAAGGTWLGAKIGADPELARKPFATTPYAFRAALADNIACTGCMSVSALKFDGDLNLGGKNLTGGVITAGQFVGDGSKLTGVTGPAAGVACKIGQAVTGFDASGVPVCAPTPLPADGLATVSNGLLTDQFVDVMASPKTNLAIPDNNPGGVSDTISVPDLGVAQALSVQVDVTNSNVAKLKITVTDPNGAEYVLWNGSGPGTVVKSSWPDISKTVSGDLSTWLGKNPTGIWTLKVVDGEFQDNGSDGKLGSWSITTKTLSAKKTASTGLFVAAGGFQLPQSATDPIACNAASAGYMYFNTKFTTLYICNGAAFFPIVTSLPGTPGNPGLSCKDVLAKAPGSASAVFWLDPDGPIGAIAPYQSYCDMVTAGGGWTLIASTKIPASGDTTWNLASTAYADLTTTKASGSPVTLYNKIPFSGLTSFRFTCFASAASSAYGIDWTFPLASGGNSALMSDIYDDAKITVYGAGKLTQSTGTIRLIGYDNGTSKADWGLGSNGADSVYWSHESWGQVDASGGHCQETGEGHTTATLGGTGIYHIWIR